MRQTPAYVRTAQISAFVTSLFLGGTAGQALADPCMQDNFKAAGNNQALNCSSNDVKIAKVTNISGITGITKNADGTLSCVEGAPIRFTADFQVQLNATTRYDIGLYLGEYQSQALTGNCSSSIITPVNATKTFISLDPAGDFCGDIDTAHNPQVVNMEVNSTCMRGSNSQLLLPNCTSWRQPGSNGTCTKAADAFPGSPSKCNCDNTFTIGVTVESPTLSVVKSASPVQVDWPGGAVTYTVTVKNNATALPVSLTTIVEDPDNNPATQNSIPYKASDICDATNLAAGASTTCRFTLPVSGDPGVSFTDSVCVSAIDGNNSPVGPAAGTCDTTSVSIKDVVPTAAVTVGVKELKCALVTYGVKVENTDPAESLTLTALNSATFGSLTSVHDSVMRTDCSVTQTIGVKDQAVSGSGEYNCSFDAYLCKASQTTAATTTALSLSQTATVSGTLNDITFRTLNEDSNSLSVTVTAQ
jgi:hypothetical protein